MTVEYIFMKRFLIAILLCGCMLQAMSQSVKKSDMEDKKMEWWKDAKFGMFIHWGVYSVPAGVYKGKKIEGIMILKPGLKWLRMPG
jgi:alpha-L-fucosidase